MKFVRHGRGAVRPYLYGPLELLSFVEEVFDATILERHDFSAESCHVELQIADGVLVVEAGALPASVASWTSSVYVYVPDVDECYRRALARGAISVAEPADKPYGERQAGFTDAAGNQFWVATCL